MESKTNVSIHNRFDIEVRDASTGELKQKGTAYNMVLNGMFTDLLAKVEFFKNIYYGTGTGTLAATRTALFTSLGNKAAVFVERSMALPTSYVKKKITLNPEDNVGAVLSEVGVYGARLVTHALIEDSEGNPITITKTATDIITIYATIFSTVTTSQTGVDIICMPSSNSLLKYLTQLDLTFNAGYGSNFYLGQSDTANNPLLPGIVAQAWASNTFVFSVIDAANKKMTTPTIRVASTEGIGDLKEFAVGNICRVLLPNASICPPKAYMNEPLGTGNAVLSKFNCPSKNIDDNTLVVKVDGATKILGVDYTVRKIAACNFQLIAPSIWESSRQPKLLGYLNRDGRIFTYSIPHKNSYSSSLQCFEIIDNTAVFFEKLSPVDYADFDYATPLRTSNNTYIGLAGLDISAGFKPAPIWSVAANGTITRELALFNVAPDTDYYGVFNEAATHYVAVSATSKALQVYKKNGATFSKIATALDTPVWPAMSKYSIVMLKYISNYLFITPKARNLYSGNHDLVVFKQTGDSFVRCTFDPTGDPNASVDAITNAGNIQDIYIIGNRAVIIRGSTIVSFYSLINDVFTYVGRNTTVRRHDWKCLCMVSDSVFYESAVSASQGASRSHRIIYYDGDVTMTYVESVEQQLNPSIDNPHCFAFNNTAFKNPKYGQDIICTDLTPRITEVTFTVPPANGAVIKADYTVNGVHKTTNYVIDVSASIQFS